MDHSVIDVLDLRRDAHLDISIGNMYDEIAMEADTKFTLFVEQLSSGLESNLDWWVSGAASRNEITSPLFHYYTSSCLVQKLVSSGTKIRTILVDTDEFGCSLSSIKYEDVIPIIKTIRSTSHLQRCRQILSPFRVLLRCIAEWFAVRISQVGKGNTSPSGTTILIDTFIIPGHIENERYYPGLWEAISSNLKRKTWFVPEFYGFSFRQLVIAASSVRIIDRNVLLKEDYIKFSDILYAYFHYWRIRQIELQISNYNGVEYQSVINAELRSSKYLFNAVRALLNYRFVMRLQQAGVEVDLALDWSENHALDRGWNAGFSEYYPTSKKIGYQGFHAPYQSLRITEYEYRAGITPAEIAVMGEGLVEDRRKYFKSLPVQIAPAFRYRSLWSDHIQEKYEVDTILIALPIDLSTSIFILEMLNEVAERFSTLDMLVKPHPATPLSSLNVDLEAENLSETNKSLASCLPSVKLSICGGITTAGLESMAYGCPVIYIAPLGKRSEIPLPGGIPQSMWRIVQEPSGLIDAINYFISFDEKAQQQARSIGNNIRASFFQPVTNEGINNLLTAHV